MGGGGGQNYFHLVDFIGKPQPCPRLGGGSGYSQDSLTGDTFSVEAPETSSIR